VQDESERLSRVIESQARGFFDSGESVWVGRAPGRLDVTGGIADYSGSVVLETPIANAAVVAVQRRPDRLLRAWTVGPEARHVEQTLVELSLDSMRDLATGELARTQLALAARSPYREQLVADAHRLGLAR